MEYFFASEISKFFSQELSKCEYRLINSDYITILEEYKNILTKKSNYDYYCEVKALVSILENESYIKLCPIDRIRNLYLECIKQCSHLYNRYMSEIR